MALQKKKRLVSCERIKIEVVPWSFHQDWSVESLEFVGRTADFSSAYAASNTGTQQKTGIPSFVPCSWTMNGY